MSECLNCGAPLPGRFCGRCGQRALPRYPTLREMVHDAWHEFSGWDGRFVRTFRTLAHPGALTIDVLEGRRARYVSPLRLYLAASVFYFLIAAAVPAFNPPAEVSLPGANRTIDVTQPLSAEDRALAERSLERAPWWAQRLIRPMVEDPVGQRARFIRTFPRALFALVPVFAAICALMYRGRPFSQHLVLVLHLSSAIFILLAVGHLSNVARSLTIVRAAAAVVTAALAAYALVSFRRVYRESWPRVVLKGVAIGALYAVALVAAIALTYAWTVLT